MAELNYWCCINCGVWLKHESLDVLDRMAEIHRSVCDSSDR